MRTGNELQAAAFCGNVLQRHPDGQLIVVESRVAERRVLMPGRGLAHPGGLHDRQIKKEASVVAQQLLGNRRRIPEALGLVQARSVVHDAENLRGVRFFRLFVAGDQFGVRAFLFSNAIPKEILNNGSHLEDFVGRGDSVNAEMPVIGVELYLFGRQLDGLSPGRKNIRFLHSQIAKEKTEKLPKRVGDSEAPSLL